MTDDAPGTLPPAATTSQGWFRGFVTFAIVLVILHQGSAFLIPVAIALLLLILIGAIGERTRRVSIGGRKIPGWLASILSLAIVVGSLTAIVLIISSQVSAIADAVPQYIKLLQQRIADLAPLIGEESSKQLNAKIENFDPRVLLPSLGTPAVWLFTSGLLIFFYTIFMIIESHAFSQKLPHIVGSTHRAGRVLGVFHSASRVVQKYMWINTLTSLIAAVLTYAILALTGTEFASALAILIFFTAFIPTIGTVLGIAVPSLLALLQFGPTGPFWIVFIGVGLMRLVVDNAVQPAMAGKGLNLSTLVVMLALAFWGGIWGLAGAFLSVPLMVVLMIIFAQFPALRPFAALMSNDGIVSEDE